MSNSLLLLCLINFSFVLSFSGQNGSDEREFISPKDSLTFFTYKKEFSRFINPKPDSANIVLKDLRSFVFDIDFTEGKVEYLYLRGSYFRRLQDSDSAIYCFNESIDLAESINYVGGKTMAYNGLCHVLSKVGKMTEAKAACENCIVFAKESGSRDTEAASYLAIGQIFMRQNELKNGLLYNLKVDSMHQVSPIRKVIIAAAYQNVGDVYLGLDELDLSEQYFLKSIESYKELPMDVTYYLKHANWYLGQLYFKKKDYQQSEDLLKDCHDYFSKIKDNHTLAEISKTLGLIQIEKQQINAGSTYLQQAYDLQGEFGNRNERAYIGLELGKLFIQQGRYEQAIKVLNQALKDVPLLNNSEILQKAHLTLGEAYSKKGDYTKAYMHTSKGSEIKDSLQLIQNAVQIRELETSYQTEQKEKEIAFLKSQNELREQQRKNQRNVLLGGIGITSIASLFFFYLFRNRQKTNRKLKEIDEAKSTFFTNISHEFRTPLTLIKGPIQEQLNRKDLPKDTRAKFEMINRNSDRLLNLVDQTLSISKLQSGSVSLNIICEDLNAFIGSLTDAFSFAAKEKNIIYNVVMNHDEVETCYDRDAIEKIITNLISNAIKYTPDGGDINIKSKIANGLFRFVIKNSGTGLGKDELNHVFDRFFQVDGGEGGVGVGLSLVKDLVKLHEGDIKVASEQSEWVEFIVNIPVNKSPRKHSTNIVQNVPAVEKAMENSFEKDEDGILPILLIVEDNEDVRYFVKGIFENNFHIIEAENGLEGVEIAIEKIPEVIISDVMMPIKDGIEMSNEIKSNQLTSHIPIILLTAKVGDENELEGIQSGADDYITKPFNVELLKSKVENLLEIRRKLRERYSQELFVKPKDISMNTADEELLEKVQTILDDKLSDGNFNVEMFSNEMGISRMQLHRKLKAITGLSASEFIRSQRIKQAAILLKTTDKNVSEIGYSVGFNDHAYFSKCFKDVFKVSPSQYATDKA